VTTARFWKWLLVVLALAFVVRVGYVAIAKRGPCQLIVNGLEVGEYHSQCTGFHGQASDQIFYNAEANTLAHGDGFTAPFKPGQQPTAEHPPLTAVVLTPVSWLFERPPLRALADRTALSNGTTVYTHVREQRYTMAVLGTLLVLLIALLGRAVAGEYVGLLAGGIAAVYPNLWVNDGLIMSETVTGLAVVAALLLACRFLRRPSVGTALGVGVASGLAALGRAEIVLFVPLLVVPIAIFVAKGASALRFAVIGCVGALLVVGPWVAYNLSRFDARTFVSTNDGIALAGSNCAPVYSGGGLGLTYLAPPCLDSPPPSGDESVVAKAYRTKAIDYMKAHKGRLWIVVGARIGRTWSLFRPVDMLSFNEGEGRERWVTALGLWTYYPLLGLGVAGAFVLARRQPRRLWILLVPAIASTIGVAVTYGQTRFRAAAEPSLVILAAVTVVAFVELLHAPPTPSINAVAEPPIRIPDATRR
jgi:hypothetical protein